MTPRNDPSGNQAWNVWNWKRIHKVFGYCGLGYRSELYRAVTRERGRQKAGVGEIRSLWHRSISREGRSQTSTAARLFLLSVIFKGLEP